jgi:hypothetical protein
MRFFDCVGRNTGEILFPIPRASTLGITQISEDLDQRA